MPSILNSLSLGRLSFDRLRTWLGRRLPRDLLMAKLEQAAQGDICPICALEGHARHVWLWSFLWESVNDPDTREEFIEGGGLCRADNWSMVEVARTRIKSSLGVAIVYEHLAKVTERALGQGGRAAEPWIDIGRWNFNIGQGCLACSTGRMAEDRSLRRLTLATAVRRPPQWLERAFPLCYGHIRQALRGASVAPVRTALAMLQKVRIQELKSAGGPSMVDSDRGPGRLEASLFPRGAQFAVPERSGGLYIGAAERCPVCRAMGEREQELLEEGYSPGEGSSPPLLCLGHHVAFSRRYGALGEVMRSGRLKDEIRFLDAGASPHDAASGSGEAEGCPICRRREEAKEEVLRARLQEWTGPAGPKDLLCLHHMGRGLAMTSGRERQRLLSDQRGKLTGLMRELGEFIAMHDYRSPRRPQEGPDSPYRRALRFFTSEPALVAPLLGISGAHRFLPTRTSPSR